MICYYIKIYKLLIVESENMKVCKVCGKELSDDYSQDKCKKCLKKVYGAEIIVKLLNHIDPEISFKKEDLISLGFPDFKVMDYIWTLQELNLISKNNSSDSYSLKEKNILNKFISKWGDLDSEDEENFVVKRCPNCGTKVEDDLYCEQCGTKLQEENDSKNIIMEKRTIPYKTKKCEYCGEKINTRAEICPKCGVRLKKAEIEKNPGLALMLSFIVPGFGQLYNNQIQKGIGFIVVWFISILLLVFIVGVFMLLIIWIYAMYDAYNTSKDLNKK